MRGVVLLLLLMMKVEGRVHYHKRDRSPSAAAASPSPSPSPVNNGVFPSDPYPYQDPGEEQVPCVFDVTSYGAVGDGSTDDTAAFQSAWRAACSVESAVILVPSNKAFTITSTIFSGPCKPGLVFQVSNVTPIPFKTLITYLRAFVSFRQLTFQFQFVFVFEGGWTCDAPTRTRLLARKR